MRASQYGFAVHPKCRQFVRSSTHKGCVVAVQGVDGNKYDGTSLGGIDLGDSPAAITFIIRCWVSPCVSNRRAGMALVAAAPTSPRQVQL